MTARTAVVTGAGRRPLTTRNDHHGLPATAPMVGAAGRTSARERARIAALPSDGSHIASHPTGKASGPGAGRGAGRAVAVAFGCRAVENGGSALGAGPGVSPQHRAARARTIRRGVADQRGSGWRAGQVEGLRQGPVHFPPARPCAGRAAPAPGPAGSTAARPRAAPPDGNPRQGGDRRDGRQNAGPRTTPGAAQREVPMEGRVREALRPGGGPAGRRSARRHSAGAGRRGVGTWGRAPAPSRGGRGAGKAVPAPHRPPPAERPTDRRAGTARPRPPGTREASPIGSTTR